MNKGALALILVAVAVVLTWVGISIFTTDPTPAPAPLPTQAAPVASSEPSPKPAAETDAVEPAEVEPKAAEQPAAPPFPINQVVPDVPRSARETIRGTIRVSIRVTVGKDGTVLDTNADEPGPSRYFARLATEAARKWTFTSTDSDTQRAALLRFYFTRAGTQANAESVK